MVTLGYHVMSKDPSPVQASASVRFWTSVVEVMLTATVLDGHGAASAPDRKEIVTTNPTIISAMTSNIMLLDVCTEEQVLVVIRWCIVTGKAGKPFKWPYPHLSHKLWRYLFAGERLDGTASATRDVWHSCNFSELRVRWPLRN